MARAYAVGTFQSLRTSWMSVSVRGIAITLLLLSLFLTAIGVVYLKDLNRRLFMQYQSLQTQSQDYQVVWSKLLLEQGTLARQSRIQQVATGKLGMVLPTQKNVVMVETDS
ncbi:MAG: cell division protein FtsL [Gammaproteobacteria bacterium]|nr:cell division protein FtsL [Gammaproteobacteria bacterium]